MTWLYSLLLAGSVAALSSLHFSRTTKSTRTGKQESDNQALPSLLVPSYTSHARLLPKSSKHAFSYPLLYVAVDIDSLTAGSLDVGRLFNYGGSPYSKVLGLRSYGYLELGQSSLREKLSLLLEGRGIAKDAVGRVWLVTMPSFVGFEGINPLSVWYVYSGRGKDGGRGDLLCIVLEVHNTFGERHAYVLQESSSHRVEANEGYDLAWTFPRSFHVSPFNSRNGYYRLDIVDPFHSGSKTTAPEIRVFLRLLTPDKTPKLQALLASSPAYPAIPLNSNNTFPLLRTLLRYPFALLLTTPRILYQAYRLHYDKRLAVYPRPEPKHKGDEKYWNDAQMDAEGLGLSVGWQAPGIGEKWAKDIVERWARIRSQQCGHALSVEFLDNRANFEATPRDEKKGVSTGGAANGQSNGAQSHSPNGRHDPYGDANEDKLIIKTADPKFYSNLIISATPIHSLAVFPELLTSVSSASLFMQFFGISNEDEAKSSNKGDRIAASTYSLRCGFLYFFFAHSLISPPPHLSHPISGHWTDSLSLGNRLKVYLIVWMAWTADKVEERIMRMVGAKFVEGRDPWKLWERALAREYRVHDGPPGLDIESDLGSILFT